MQYNVDAIGQKFYPTSSNLSKSAIILTSQERPNQRPP